MCKAVIFDLDGTLTQSEEGIYNSVKYAAEKLVLAEPDVPTLRKFVGPPLEYSFQEYLGLDAEKALLATAAFRERYFTIGLFENRLYPGIRRLLRTLKREGWYVAIATGKLQNTAERVIAYFHLDRYIDKIVGTGLVANADKKMLVTSALPKAFGEAFMVGDRKFDILGGKDAGIKTIGVGYGYGSEEELRDAGCDVYAATVQDLTDLLCPGAAPMSDEPCRAAIFDLDGTLTQSEEGIWNCVKHAARKLGFEEPDAPTLRKFIGPPLLYSFKEYMGMSEEMADRAVAAYRERYTTVGLFENRVYPGIRRLLRTLKANGWYVAIATGKPQSPAERIIEHFGLARYFDKLIGSSDKASADKKQLIEAVLPEVFDEAWMIGDRKFDILGGKAVGIKTIGVGYGYGSEEEHRAAGCDAYVPTVQDLIDFLCPGAQPPKGAFLSIEGLDGSGKTTQINRLTDAMDRYGFEVVHSREPGGCPISEKIREIILDKNNVEMDGVTEALLYASSRAQHVRQVIRPAIDAGKVILCDRYVDSSVAYQGGGRQLGVQRILDINAPAVDGTWPMATIYLDIDHKTSLQRRLNASEPDRLELEADSFHARVEAGYKELIARDPARFVVVDATQSPDEIARQVAEQVLSRLIDAENE